MLFIIQRGVFFHTICFPGRGDIPHWFTESSKSENGEHESKRDGKSEHIVVTFDRPVFAGSYLSATRLQSLTGKSVDTFYNHYGEEGEEGFRNLCVPLEILWLRPWFYNVLTIHM